MIFSHCVIRRLTLSPFPSLILSPYDPPPPLGQTDLTNIDKAISEAEATDEQGKAKARRVSIDIHTRFDADGDGEVRGAVYLKPPQLGPGCVTVAARLLVGL